MLPLLLRIEYFVVRQGLSLQETTSFVLIWL